MNLSLLLCRLSLCAFVAFCLMAPLPASAQSHWRIALGVDSNNWKARGGDNPEAEAFSSDFIHNLRFTATVDLLGLRAGPGQVVTYAYTEWMLPLDFNDETGSGNARQFLKLFQYPGVGLGARVRVGSVYVSGGLGVYLFFKPSASQESHTLSATVGGRLFVGHEDRGRLFYEIGTSVADFRRDNFTPGVALNIGIRL